MARRWSGNSCGRHLRRRECSECRDGRCLQLGGRHRSAVAVIASAQSRKAGRGGLQSRRDVWPLHRRVPVGAGQWHVGLTALRVATVGQVLAVPRDGSAADRCGVRFDRCECLPACTHWCTACDSCPTNHFADTTVPPVSFKGTKHALGRSNECSSCKYNRCVCIPPAQAARMASMGSPMARYGRCHAACQPAQGRRTRIVDPTPLTIPDHAARQEQRGQARCVLACPKGQYKLERGVFVCSSYDCAMCHHDDPSICLSCKPEVNHFFWMEIAILPAHLANRDAKPSMQSV